MDVSPHISVEKYLATDDPKNAPNEPPALMIPKNLLESVWLKKLIIVTQNIETTKNNVLQIQDTIDNARKNIDNIHKQLLNETKIEKYKRKKLKDMKKNINDIIS